MRQVVLELPDDIVERAESEARLRSRSPESLLSETLVDRLRHSDPASDLEKWAEMDLSGLPDELLQAHIRTPLPATFEARMTELQRANERGDLDAGQRDELGRMLRVVHSSTILKALALAAWKARYGKLPDRVQADW